MNRKGRDKNYLGLHSSPNVHFNEKTPPAIRMLYLDEIMNTCSAPDSEVVEVLLVNVLKEDKNSIVRHEAAFVLGKLYERGDIVGRQAVKALIEAARNDSSIIVRHEATESLGQFNNVQHVLKELATDKNSEVAVTAQVALEYQKLAGIIPS